MLTRSDLYRYQLRAIAHELANPYSALWVDMGLGKTVSTLTAFADALNSYDARRMLVVAPLRVARDVWADEIENWAHLQGLTTAKIIGTEEQRLRALRTPADIHLINREQISWLEAGFIEQVSRYKYRQYRRWPWDWLVLDESQSFKSQTTKRWQAMDRICRFLRPQRITQLTGTPAPNGYKDLWGQMFLLDGGKRLGRTEDAFQKRWFDCTTTDHGAIWTLKPYAAAQIQAAVADIVLSMVAEDYLDLPPIKYNPVRVTLSDAAMRQYKKLQRTYVLELDTHKITAANAGVLGQKLLQLASGAIYVNDRGDFQRLHDAKIEALAETLDGLKHSGPVVIGYGFKHETARLATFLDKFCRDRGWTWSQLKKANELKAFAAGLTDIGLMHPLTGGHGLNDLHLSGSENIVWFGPTNNLELWDQLNARIAGGHRRMGKNVVIHVIVARDTVDESYVDMLKRKDMDQRGLVLALRRDI